MLIMQCSGGFLQKRPETKMVPRYHGDAITIDQRNLEEYLGKAPFDLDRFYKRTPVGVVMGLAWTSMGGSTLYVESNRVSTTSTAEPSLTITGVRTAANSHPTLHRGGCAEFLFCLPCDKQKPANAMQETDV
jgi:hypothetical protein